MCMTCKYIKNVRIPFKLEIQCLMPNTESLHGNFPPVFYKLSCGIIFFSCYFQVYI